MGNLNEDLNLLGPANHTEQTDSYVNIVKNAIIFWIHLGSCLGFLSDVVSGLA